jgi:PAS domain S-box-containing protein
MQHGTHPMVRINYAIRAGSFAYSFLVLGLHGWERGYGAAFWALLAAQFLVYPHVMYLRARHSVQPRRAEENNLYVDAALLGAWIAGLNFPLWIAYGALFSTTLNSAVVRGTQGGLASLASFIFGALGCVALVGFQYLPDTGNLVTALCFLGSLGYAGWVGWVANMLRKRIAAGRSALRESEALYRLITENAADLIALVDQHGRWHYASPSYAKMLEPADLAPGADSLKRLHPDDADRARIAVTRAAASGKPRELALRLVDRDGRIRQLKTRVQAVNSDEISSKKIVLVSQDVTDLHESEERMLLAAHALEGMTEAIMITSADGAVLTVNRAFSEITGHSRDDVLGQPEIAIRSGLQPADFYDELYATVKREGYWSGTTWSRRKNGAVYREWRSVRAVRDPAGAVTHYVSVFYEVDSRGGQDSAARDAPDLPLRA